MNFRLSNDARLWLILTGTGIAPLLALVLLTPLFPGNQLSLTVIIILVTGFVAWWLSRLQFGTNLDQLLAQHRSFAERVAAGDLTARLDLTTAQSSQTLLHLSTELNHMVEAVHGIVADLKATSTDVTGAATAILEATN